MELALIKINSPEWNYMWDWISTHPMNEGLDKPSIAYNEGEMWQYMGSFKQKNQLVHSFRHRQHPMHNQRVDLHLKASDDFTEEQIEKNLKLK